MLRSIAAGTTVKGEEWTGSLSLPTGRPQVIQILQPCGRQHAQKPQYAVILEHPCCQYIHEPLNNLTGYLSRACELTNILGSGF